MNFNEKVVLVTGASSGIGKAVATHFAQKGAKVAVVDIDEAGGQEVVEAIQETGGEAMFVQADSSSPEACAAAVEKIVDAYGALHIAINNAGIGGQEAPTGEYDIDTWDKVISVNLSGVFYGMRYQLSAMEENEDGGVIINMASILGQVGAANSPAYVSAKHGVVGLTKAAALEYAEKGVRINAVGPGYIKTPLLEKHLSDEQLEGIQQMHPMNRLGTPEEIASLVLWLASDEASFVTGSYYNADGGYLAQ